MTAIATDTSADIETVHRTGPIASRAGILRRHGFIIPTFVLVMGICLWFVTFGDGRVFGGETFCGFYDAQARALLAGRLDVPKEAIGFEAFYRDGKTYGYFGIGPALLRLPLVTLFPKMDGHWSRLMMLAGCLINLICAYRLFWAIEGHAKERSRWQKWMISLFIVCAGLGSTNVFLASRSFVYHEAIVWASAFALLFVDRLIAYLRKPSLGTLAWAGVFAFMSLQSRVTIGAGTMMGMGMLTVILVYRAWSTARFPNIRRVGVLAHRLRCAPESRRWASTPTLQENTWSPLPVLRERVRAECRIPKSDQFPSPQPSPGVPGEGAEADQNRSGDHFGPVPTERSASPFGLGPTPHPFAQALVAALFLILSIGVSLGVNYAKFRTFDGMPVRLYGRFSESPIRLKATDGKQFHPENLVTGLASYFGPNVLEIGPEFPWVYMDHAPRMVGSPSIDLVERYSSVLVCMPALFLLVLIGWHPIAEGRTENLRRLRIPALAMMLGGGIFLMGVGYTQRYLHDLYPFLMLVGAVGVWRLMRGGILKRDVAVFFGLTLISVILNCAFAYDFQGEICWGVPNARRQEFLHVRQAVNRALHRQAVATTEE